MPAGGTLAGGLTARDQPDDRRVAHRLVTALPLQRDADLVELGVCQMLDADELVARMADRADQLV